MGVEIEIEIDVDVKAEIETGIGTEAIVQLSGASPSGPYIYLSPPYHFYLRCRDRIANNNARNRNIFDPPLT